MRVQGYDFDEPDAEKLLKTRTPVDVGKSIVNTHSNFTLYSTNTRITPKIYQITLKILQPRTMIIVSPHETIKKWKGKL
jgi:hypothetical protein